MLGLSHFLISLCPGGLKGTLCFLLFSGFFADFQTLTLVLALLWHSCALGLLSSHPRCAEMTAESKGVRLKMQGPQASPRAVAFREARGPNMRFLSFFPFF